MNVREHRWLLAVLLVALLAGCSGGPAQVDVRPLLSFGSDTVDLNDPAARGKALLAMGQYGLAIEALQEALADEPNAARTLGALAIAYDKIGRHDLADRYFAQALAQEPRSVATLNNWGYSRLLRGDNALALALLQKAAGEDAGNPIVSANLALAEGTGSVPDGQAAAAIVPAPETAPIALQPQLDAQDQPIPAAARSRITVLRQVPAVVRMASGVQLLITHPLATVGPSSTPESAAVPAATANAVVSPPDTSSAAMPIIASAPVMAVETVPLSAVPSVPETARSGNFRPEPPVLLALLGYVEAGPVVGRTEAASSLWTQSYAFAGPATAPCGPAAPKPGNSDCVIAQLAERDLLIAAAEFAAEPAGLSIDDLSASPLFRREYR